MLIAIAAGGPVPALLVVSAALLVSSSVVLFTRAIFAAVLIGVALRSRTIAQPVSIQLGHVILRCRTAILRRLAVLLLGFLLPRGSRTRRRTKAVDRAAGPLLPGGRLRGITRRAARLPRLAVNRTEAALLLRIVPGPEARASGRNRGYIRREGRFLQLILRLGVRRFLFFCCCRRFLWAGSGSGAGSCSALGCSVRAG